MIKSDGDYLYTLADREKLDKGIAHVIDSPLSCVICLMWDCKVGNDGLCDYCRKEEREWLEKTG